MSLSMGQNNPGDLLRLEPFYCLIYIQLKIKPDVSACPPKPKEKSLFYKFIQSTLFE